MAEEKGLNRSVERAIQILKTFSYNDEELSLAYIAGQTGIPKTTVFRILNTLEEDNLVMRTPDGLKYRLGYELIKMGAIAQAGNPLNAVAYRYMVDVSRETEQTCNLYIKEGFERVCIAQVTGSQYVRKYSYLGARHPLYCGAGKLLLAFSEDRFIENYLKNVELKKITENTVTSVDELKHQIEEIRRADYSVSKGERDPITAMIAVPVRDYTGKVVAALTVSGPMYYFDDEERFTGCLKHAAGEISKKLGYLR